MSVQAHVLDVLETVQARSGAACLLIRHSLGVVRGIAARTMVLRGGREVESGPTDTVFDSPAGAYTRLLLDAALRNESATEDRETS